MRKTIDEYKKEYNSFSFFKKDISIYINGYLENDDEFTEINEEKFRRIQNDDKILTRLATELYNNEVLNAIDNIDRFNYERNYYISELLDKEI